MNSITLTMLLLMIWIHIPACFVCFYTVVTETLCTTVVLLEETLPNTFQLYVWIIYFNMLDACLVCLVFNRFNSKMCAVIYLWKAAQPGLTEMQKQQEIRRRTLTRKRARVHFRSTTPEALQGRKHIDVQTGQPFPSTTASVVHSGHYDKCCVEDTTVIT